MGLRTAAVLGVTFVALSITARGSAIAQDLGGSTYPGPYYMGSAEAPVTLQEYADFQ